MAGVLLLRLLVQIAAIAPRPGVTWVVLDDRGMTRAMTGMTKIEQKLASVLLTLFMILHAPFAGLMTAHAAVPSGGGPLVICAGDGFTQVPGTDRAILPAHAEDCLCPAGTPCSGADASGAAAAFPLRLPPLMLLGQGAQEQSPAVSKSGWRPGTPRSPPMRFI
ncbi:MAG: hypothetical protein AAF441_18870 [Pseudomonadota bacterium]